LHTTNSKEYLKVALINWNDSFSVKVSEIDQQHKTLIAMVNELHDAMKVGKGRDVLGSIVENLIRYTSTHFALEEKYFAQYGYPEMDSHMKEHASFVQKVSEFQEGFKGRNLTLSVEVMKFLSDWLQSHILGSDMKYSQFFKESGLR